MKKVISIFLFVSLSYILHAQVEDPDSKPEAGGFGSIMTSFRSLDGNLAIYSGGGGGFIVNDFRIGVFFNGLTNSFSKQDTSSTSYKLGCSYGGLWLGYPILKDKPFHMVADLKISYGNTRLINTNWEQISNGSFLGIAPSFGVEYEISEVFLISGGVEYHYSYFPTAPTYYTASSFSSPGIYLSIKLGTF